MASVIRQNGTPIVIKGVEAAGSQSFKEGDLIQFNADGKVAIAAEDVIDGIARANASGTTDASIDIELIDPAATYVGYYSTTTAQNIVGNIADFTVVTAGGMRLTTGGTTDAYIVALDPRDAVGTDGGRVIFRFLGSLFDSRG